MAYFNYTFAAQKGITPQDITNLQLISQNRSEDLSQYIEKYVNTASLTNYQEKGLIEYVKPKKKSDTAYNTIRLSGKGKELLESLQIPEICADDLTIFAWAKGVYLSSEREIGNAKKTKLWIALFRVNSGISKNSLAFLLQSFLNDEENFKYSQRLEYLFFKPANMYEKFDIEQSKLYQYYLNRKGYFDKQFEKFE